MAQDASEGRLGVITRRALFGAAAGACWPRREYLVLEAIAAERMPHRMVVRGVEWSPYFELRDYGTPEVCSILEKWGMKPVLREGGRLLFAFESLAQRERAWRELSFDADWKCADLREVALYRPEQAPRLASLGVRRTHFTLARRDSRPARGSLRRSLEFLDSPIR